jgi:sentrin-specific protease 1
MCTTDPSPSTPTGDRREKLIIDSITCSVMTPGNIVPTTRRMTRKGSRPAWLSLSVEQAKEAAQYMRTVGNVPRRGEPALVVPGYRHLLTLNMATLNPGGWLDDEVINQFIDFIIEEQQETCTSVIVFSTMFFTSLQRWKNTYNDLMRLELVDDGSINFEDAKLYVRRGRVGERVNITTGDAHHILIPINITNNHWVLSDVCIPDKSISYLDGMQGSDYTRRLEQILLWLEKEFERKGAPFNKAEWKFVHRSDIPMQRNSYDCGVFLCAFVECIALRNSVFDFAERDMTNFRLRMALAVKYRRLPK